MTDRLAKVACVMVLLAWSHEAGAQALLPGPNEAPVVQGGGPAAGGDVVRISGVRRIARRKGGRTKTTTVDLVIDPHGGTLRLEPAAAEATVIPLGTITAVHFESDRRLQVLRKRTGGRDGGAAAPGR